MVTNLQTRIQILIPKHICGNHFLTHLTMVVFEKIPISAPYKGAFVFYTTISFTTTLTDSLPFQIFLSSSTTRETISPVVSVGFLVSQDSPHHHATSLVHGADARRSSRCFHSFPRGFASSIVSSERRKRGLRFPIPNGRYLSMISRFSRVKSFDGYKIHSMSITRLGRLCTSCMVANASRRRFLSSGILLSSIVNPAACLCPPYLMKRSLAPSRSSIIEHHSGERQEATEVGVGVFECWSVGEFGSSPL
jgi:hypothetical protein